MSAAALGTVATAALIITLTAGVALLSFVVRVLRQDIRAWRDRALQAETDRDATAESLTQAYRAVARYAQGALHTNARLAQQTARANHYQRTAAQLHADLAGKAYPRNPNPTQADWDAALASIQNLLETNPEDQR